MITFVSLNWKALRTARFIWRAHLLVIMAAWYIPCVNDNLLFFNTKGSDLAWALFVSGVECFKNAPSTVSKRPQQFANAARPQPVSPSLHKARLALPITLLYKLLDFSVLWNVQNSVLPWLFVNTRHFEYQGQYQIRKPWRLRLTAGMIIAGVASAG